MKLLQELNTISSYKPNKIITAILSLALGIIYLRYPPLEYLEANQYVLYYFSESCNHLQALWLHVLGSGSCKEKPSADAD